MTTLNEAEAPAPTFRHFRLDDLDEAFATIEASFGPTWPDIPLQVKPVDHLVWKMSGPAARPDDCEIVEVDGRSVGYVGGSTRNVWVRGRELPGWHGGDMCIHPDFQGRGFMRLWDAWFDAQQTERIKSVEIDEGSTHPRLLGMQKRDDDRRFLANRVDNLVRDLRPPRGRRSQRFGPRALFKSARRQYRLAANRLGSRPYSSRVTGVTLATVDEFDARANDLWERARDAFDYAVIRDAAYLNWRYCDPRAGVYRVRTAMRGDDLVGFMVSALHHADLQLVDLLTLPGDEDALRALIEDAVEEGVRTDARTITVRMPRQHPYRAVFQRYRFIRANWISNMGFPERDDTLLDFLETDRRARVHTAFGDSDHI